MNRRYLPRLLPGVRSHVQWHALARVLVVVHARRVHTAAGGAPDGGPKAKVGAHLADGTPCCQLLTTLAPSLVARSPFPGHSAGARRAADGLCVVQARRAEEGGEGAQRASERVRARACACARARAAARTARAARPVRKGLRSLLLPAAPRRLCLRGSQRLVRGYWRLAVARALYEGRAGGGGEGGGEDAARQRVESSKAARARKRDGIRTHGHGGDAREAYAALRRARGGRSMLLPARGAWGRMEARAR